MLLARRDLEELILELVPVATRFVELFFCDMRDIHLFIAAGLAELPDEIIQLVAEERSFRRPKRQARATSSENVKRSSLGPSFLWSRFSASSRIVR